MAQTPGNHLDESLNDTLRKYEGAVGTEPPLPPWPLPLFDDTIRTLLTGADRRVQNQ